MRHSIFALLAAVGVLFFSNCSKDKNKELSFNKEVVELQGKLPSGVEPYSTVQVTAEADWTATSNQEWCRLSTRSGNTGTTNLTISAPDNETASNRNAVIAFKTSTGSTQTLEVVQKVIPTIKVTPDNIRINSNAVDIMIELESNIDLQNFHIGYKNYVIGGNAWFYSYMAQTWLHGYKAQGRIIIEKNPAPEPRSGKYIVKEPGSGVELVIPITQEGTDTGNPPVVDPE